MAKIVNLKIKPQSGSGNTYFATWDFKDTVAANTGNGSNNSSGGSSSSGPLKVGSLVSIKPGATYYNGVSIPNWVMNDKWYIAQLKGDRAVLGKNQSGSNNIQSPVNTKNLTVVSGAAVATVSEVATVSSDSEPSEKTLDHYEVKWYYDTGDSEWFEGGTSDVKEKNALYSAPENSIQLKVSVKPISKTYTVNDKETVYWTASATIATHSISADPPEKPSAPEVKIEKNTLTATLENIPDARADKMYFEVYNGTRRFATGAANVVTRLASFSCNVNPGGEYRARCKAININSSTEVIGQWSDYSNIVKTAPNAPMMTVQCKATSDTSVYLEWIKTYSAETYDIEYTTKKEYFDGSDQTTVISDIEFTHYEKTGLETGTEYFFRVRAANEAGTSVWSDVVSVVIGKEPVAPTTWSSTTTAIVGEPLILYWVHNAEDGSSQTYAEIEITVAGTTETYTIRNDERPEEDRDKTSFYEFDTSDYPEGTKVEWRVRTAGVTKAYGDWSIQRTVDIYAPPTLELNVVDSNNNHIDTLTSFPCYISALAGPNTQMPIGYHVIITANEGYETVDNVGNSKIVSSGDRIYSQYFDTSHALLVELLPSSVDFQSGIAYTVTCTVSMNSGLTKTESVPLNVLWDDESYEPNVGIALDTNNYSVYLRPYCIDENENFIEDVTLSVYRREFDGSFTEIATGIDNMVNAVITDPHPSLDYARYRILAISKTTGAVSFYDAPGYPINCKSVIIQWDEEWTSFNTLNEDALEEQPWIGSFLKLPYNIDVSEKVGQDVAFIEYIGRSHPTSYYGTQLGYTASWSVDIDKDDAETIYALRRLNNWMGDVYVREPSGTGYWANINVSFNLKHRELTVPVSIDITRVEGGM